MPQATRTVLQPHKRPVQARSTASVDAILDATLQVLTAIGRERLTTTRVAARAGVSVGTLYQYFPNKSALLQACLRRHMEEVVAAVEGACRQYRSCSLGEMADGLVAAYLSAKMRSVHVSAALYAVSSDVDGAAISKAAGARSLTALAQLLSTAREGLNKEAETVAAVVMAALNGVSRRVLEAQSPQEEAERLRGELLVLLHSYLRTCAAEPCG